MLSVSDGRGGKNGIVHFLIHILKITSGLIKLCIYWLFFLMKLFISFPCFSIDVCGSIMILHILKFFFFHIYVGKFLSLCLFFSFGVMHIRPLFLICKLCGLSFFGGGLSFLMSVLMFHLLLSPYQLFKLFRLLLNRMKTNSTFSRYHSSQFVTAP